MRREVEHSQAMHAHPPFSTSARDIALCFQFLSRIPLPEALVSHDKPDFTHASWAFPVAGALIAVPALATVLIGYLLALPISMITALAIVVLVFTTGGLHEDGVADVADGFGGGHTKDRKLDIMKDSRVGAYGVIALALIFGLRFTGWSFIAYESLFLFSAGLIASQLMSRTAQVHLWHGLPSAREGGLAQSVGQPSASARNLAAVIGVFTTIALILSFVDMIRLVAALLFVGFVTWAFMIICRRQIGGHTGDTIGAVQIIAEIAFIIGLLTFSA
ncbi:MAG: adenosylcobinamide-GDP ribazoletransferase [Pseudomonadota bacterium]